MRYRRRIYYTEAQKALMWDRWQKGDSLHTIAGLFDRGHSSIARILSETGGIRPPSRRRSSVVLTLAEREEISRGLAKQLSMRAIATQLGRSPSTVSREIHRNGGLKQYRASQADQAAWDRAHRPKPCKLATHPKLRHLVARKLGLHWSTQANSRLVAKNLSRQREPSGVTRNDLSQSVYPGPRRAEKGIASAP